MNKEKLSIKSSWQEKPLIVFSLIILFVAIVSIAVVLVPQRAEKLSEETNKKWNEIRESDRNLLYAAEITNPGTGMSLEIDTTLKEICNTGSRSCGEIDPGFCSGKVNLCSLVPDKISSIPKDPGLNENGSETGYWIAKSYDGLKIGIVIGNKKIDCPEGYVSVPGNPLYETDDFCVMKYQAKALNVETGELSMDGCGGFWDIDRCSLRPPISWADDNYIPVSVPEARPWVGLSLYDPEGYDIKDACESVDAKLMSNAQWMTIARNIEAIGENWTGGTPGKGSLIQGNSFAPLEEGPLPAENEGKGKEKRVFELTNGEVIWDLSGNVWEWLDDSASYNEQLNTTPIKDLPTEGEDSGIWLQWFEIDNYGDKWDHDFYRASKDEWGTAQGMGKVFIRNDEDRVFRRGGRWSDGSYAGVYSINFRTGSHVVHSITGFRCVK